MFLAEAVERLILNQCARYTLTASRRDRGKLAYGAGCPNANNFLYFILKIYIVGELPLDLWPTTPLLGKVDQESCG